MENNIFWIKTVKKVGNSFKVNGTVLVPSEDGNAQYEDLKLWLLNNTPEPEFTEEELVALEVRKTKKAKKAKRAELLEKGMLTADGKMWFNEKYATMFMVKVSGAIACKLKSVKWKDANREVVEVSIDDAKVYIKEIIEALDTVYLGE